MIQVKSICCFSGRPRFDSQCPHGGLTTNHPYSVPQDLLNWRGLLTSPGRGTHVVFTYACRQTLNTRESYLLKGWWRVDYELFTSETGLEFLFKYPNSHITNWVWSTFPGNPSTEWGVDRRIAGLSLASSLVLVESDRGLHLLPSSGACTSTHTHTHHIHVAHWHMCTHTLHTKKL